MAKQSDLDAFKKQLADFTPAITTFERSLLIPEIVGRLGYIRSTSVELRAICAEPNLARRIDADIRSLVIPERYSLTAPPPEVGQAYLNGIFRQLQEQYIDHIDKLLAVYPITQITTDFDTLTDFINRSRGIFEAFVSLEKVLFQYSVRRFLLVVDTATGQTISTEPQSLSFILSPFQNHVQEIARVCEATRSSIDEWATQIRNQKARHVDLLVSVSEVAAAKAQASAAKYSLVFQIAVIVFAVALLFVGNWTALFAEKSALETELQSAKSAENIARLELERTRGELIKSHAEVKMLHDKLPKSGDAKPGSQ